ncbi:MAG: DUF2269 domain-containing protein [Actinomycetota bacterium]|nr:DUF2269 domain-containing protein [Actinomycetota bacterium]
MKVLLTVHVLARRDLGRRQHRHAHPGPPVLNRGDNREIHAFSMEVNKVAMRLYAPISLILLIAGIFLVDKAGYDFSQAWIVIALAGWLFSFIVGVGYYGPQDKKLQELVKERAPTIQAWLRTLGGPQCEHRRGLDPGAHRDRHHAQAGGLTLPSGWPSRARLAGRPWPIVPH